MKTEKELDLDFNFIKWGVKEVQAQVGVVKRLKDDLYKQIFSIKKGERTFENTLLILDNFSREYSRIASRVSTVMNLHIDERIRTTAQKTEVELGKIAIEVDNDYKLFQAVQSYLEDAKMQEIENLDQVQKYIIKQTILGYKRSGMLLPAKERALLKKKKQQIQKLESDYSLEYNNSYSKGIWLKDIELNGVPEALKSGWQKRDDKYLVRYVDRGTLMSYCVDRETRKKFYDFSQTVGSRKNLERLQKTVALRQEMAEILGYKTYEEYVLETELVNTSKDLDKFLKDFDKAIYKSAKSDWKKITDEAKVQVFKKIEAWDTGYLAKLVEEKRAQINSETLSEHLEYERVLEVLFDLIKNVFGIEVKQVAGDMTFFDPQARLYEWKDEKSGKVLGYSLLDLFPRTGKYGHFCVSWCDLNTQESRYNSRVLIANFQVMKKGGKRLLSFGDVSSLLHEMGHMLHSMADTSPYISTSMWSVSRDFVEIPSQFMECFWEEDEFVKKFLKHYETGKSLQPAQRKLIAQKNTAFLAHGFARSYDFVAMDRELHGKNFKKYTQDLEALRKLGAKKFAKSQKDMNLKTHPQQMFLASFGHIMGGYEAKYYSYLASYAYMREVWQHFKNQKINKKSGLGYRNKVLSVGSMKDEKDILESYLGRKATFTEFKKFLDSIS